MKMKPVRAVSHEERVRERMRERVERLHRLLALNAPSMIIAQSARAVFDCAILLNPDAAAKEFFENIYTRLRTRSGFCSTPTCENDVGASAYAPLCFACDEDLARAANALEFANEGEIDEDPSDEEPPPAS